MRRHLCIVLWALSMWLCGCNPRVRPNVLLLVMDTTRADRIGAYGHAAARTVDILAGALA